MFADQPAVMEFCLWLGDHVCHIPRIIRQPPLHTLQGPEGIFAVDMNSWKKARREANEEVCFQCCSPTVIRSFLM